jgi:GWxTD domain-containing protein
MPIWKNSKTKDFNYFYINFPSVKKGFLYFICFIILFTVSCNEQKKLVRKQNQAVLYKPSASIVRPEFTVYHISDSISQLYIKINLDDLVFNQANPENKLTGKVRIKYQIYDITDNATSEDIIDSLSISKDLVRLYDKQIAILTFIVKTMNGKMYRAKVEVYDLIRELGNQSFVTIDKRNNLSHQNFRIVQTGSNVPSFKQFFSSSDSFRIWTRKPINQLFIKYSASSLNLPPPPFTSLFEPTYSFKADSVWVIPYSKQKIMTLPYKGLYLLQIDSMATEGLYLANSGNSFPRVEELETMIPPLEYLTTTEEFKLIAKEENKKLAMDNFWLKLSKNTEVSRELIRIYYNRMQYANVYFSGFKPGWKTDRGMIYMIFGPPSYIRKTALSETWEYYVRQNSTNLTITFLKTFSPYTENHYTMQRNETFTPFWRDAVSSWRNGNAYSLEE